MMHSRRFASERDMQIGAMVRTFREEQGLSQQSLAAQIGVSFQQLQKYERGVNRISASRLAEIAAALSKPIAEFFPPEPKSNVRGPAVSDADLELVRFQGSTEGRELLRAFLRVRHRGTRKRIIHLAQTIADENRESTTSD